MIIISIPKENVQMGKIVKLLENAPTDDGTLYSSIYDLYVFIGLAKGVDDMRNGRGMTLEESRERMMKKYANYNTRYGS